ncbi:helix-turn-helix transcriptional regulator [Spirillospora sp. NPDC047279]|uniref:helix-turn-helix transcriptional regulator n=1 Tax=Spirillospora sp. NPDC047279 TaxID=3155478 RepID=UPI0033EA75A7
MFSVRSGAIRHGQARSGTVRRGRGGRADARRRGPTNWQIADRLFLSHRTVDTHVASLLAKTGTASRLELRAQSLP